MQKTRILAMVAFILLFALLGCCMHYAEQLYNQLTPHMKQIRPYMCDYADGWTLCCVPASAISSDGCVYIIEEKKSALGGRAHRLRRIDVTVVAEEDGYVLLQENLTRFLIAAEVAESFENGMDVIPEYTSENK